MLKLAVPVAAILGCVGVALGAMGAHTFEATLVANGRLDTFHTAAHYHQIHAIVLLVIALASPRLSAKWASWSVGLFYLGIVAFSGSLYVLSLANIRWMGAVAPIGGSALMLGWLFLIPASKPLWSAPENG